MPPRAKYTQDEVLDAAFDILRQEGPQALTARHLGEKLGGSARPIFTLFSSMQDVLDGAMDRAKDLYTTYLSRGLRETPPFKGTGMAHVQFAADEPLLFREIFMRPGNAGWGGPDMFLQSQDNYGRVLGSITDYYHLPEQTARPLYEHLWVYTHGLATLIATGVLEADMEYVSTKLTEVFSSMLPRYLNGDLR